MQLWWDIFVIIMQYVVKTKNKDTRVAQKQPQCVRCPQLRSFPILSCQNRAQFENLLNSRALSILLQRLWTLKNPIYSCHILHYLATKIWLIIWFSYNQTCTTPYKHTSRMNLLNISYFPIYPILKKVWDLALQVLTKNLDTL